MRATVVLLLSGFLLVTYQGKISVNADFISDILADVEHMNEQIRNNVNAQVALAKGAAAEAIKKAKARRPKAGDNANSHVVNSGKDSKGRPYYMESEDVVVGNTLFHTERVYNATTKRIDETSFSIDLTDPKAAPVPGKKRRQL